MLCACLGNSHLNNGRRAEKAGVSKSHVTLLCANALHRKFRLSELETILGSSIVKEFEDRILCHDAED